MPNEVIPLGDFEKERWRGQATLKWLAENEKTLGPQTLLRSKIEDVLNYIKDLTSYREYLFPADSPLTKRFLVLHLILHEAEPGDITVDEHSWKSFDDIAEAQGSVEDHIFQWVPSEYSHESRVFDANIRREYTFQKIQKIEWNDSPAPEKA